MNHRWGILALMVLLGCAVGLRAWDFPARYELRGMDEVQYTEGSLELLEGMTPAYKYAPAGPQTWLGWAYAGSLATKYMVKPTAEERAAPLQVRPFVAVNHALFDLYRDLSGIRRFVVIFTVVLSVIAAWAAFAVGMKSGGLSGGVLLGGLFATPWIIVNYCEQARSFSIAWSFIMIAVYFAAIQVGRRAVIGSAIFAGLAIAQRIDMLALLPLVWLELGYVRRSQRQAVQLATDSSDQVTSRPFHEAVRVWFQHTGAVAITSLLFAPWILTNLIGNLRTIASVRFSPPPVPIPWTIPLLEFSWQQGLGVVGLLFVAGTIFGLVNERLSKPLFCIYALLLLPSVVKSTGHEIAHQSVAILPLFMAAPIAIPALSKSRAAVWTMVLLCLLLPLTMTIREIRQQHHDYTPDTATAWVESHVPSGTVVMITPIFNDPLPTVARADALWQEEMNNDAAMKKFRAGLSRFHLTDVDVPRALSEENMIVERVERRGWYILGSRTWLPDRRYDIHLYGQSMVFGNSTPLPEFSKLGGVLIWRGTPLPDLHDPVIKWVNADGLGTYIYCSDDIKSKLN